VSVRWKLVGALVVTAVLATLGGYFLTTRALEQRFAAYRVEERRANAQEFARILASWWEVRRTWMGVDQLFRTRVEVVVLRGGRIVSQTSTLGQYLLLDSEGKVVACVEQAMLGRCTVTDSELAESARRWGVPIQVGGQVVGTLVPLSVAGLTPLEEDFLNSVRRGTLWGGVIALAVAAVLGTVLVVQLVSRLRQLMGATARLAHGDLAHRVQVRSKDEIGRLAQAFNHMAGALERSEKARQNMLADVAHELRTPLSVIRGNLEAMIDGVFPLTSETLAPVYEETLQLGELVEDLRTLTLAEAGHLELVREKCDVGELVKAAAEGARAGAADQNVEVRVEVTPGLWAFVDARRIRQVLGNLLSNALRFAPQGSTVTLKAYRRGPLVEVSVADQGPGFAPDDLPHLFERFYKGDKARSGEGSGLGLAIAKELVELHGGSIWAENDGGAVVRFTLPLVDGGEKVA